MTDDDANPVDTARSELVSMLYTAIDYGLGKRDSYKIVDLIEALIDAKVKAAMSERKD